MFWYKFDFGIVTPTFNEVIYKFKTQVVNTIRSIVTATSCTVHASFSIKISEILLLMALER